MYYTGVRLTFILYLQKERKSGAYAANMLISCLIYETVKKFIYGLWALIKIMSKTFVSGETSVLDIPVTEIQL